MKKLLLITCILTACILEVDAQQELLEQDWILHYMVVDDVIYEVPQPSPQNPDYQPGIVFFEDSQGLNVNAIISFNYYFNLEPVIADPNEFRVDQGAVTLGECEIYCDLEGLYLGTILLGDGLPRTFGYEIMNGAGTEKTLIVTSPEGDIAVHGNYALSVQDMLNSSVSMYPNPTSDFLFITSDRIPIKKVAIYNPTGQLVLEQAGEVTQVNVSMLNQGIYFVELTSEAGKTVQKFIKE